MKEGVAAGHCQDHRRSVASVETLHQATARTSDQETASGECLEIEAAGQRRTTARLRGSYKSPQQPDAPGKPAPPQNMSASNRTDRSRPPLAQAGRAPCALAQQSTYIEKGHQTLYIGLVPGKSQKRQARHNIQAIAWKPHERRMFIGLLPRRLQERRARRNAPSG